MTLGQMLQMFVVCCTLWSKDSLPTWGAASPVAQVGMVCCIRRVTQWDTLFFPSLMEMYICSLFV